jgi:hypothetical protein
MINRYIGPNSTTDESWAMFNSELCLPPRNEDVTGDEQQINSDFNNPDVEMWRYLNGIGM